MFAEPSHPKTIRRSFRQMLRDSAQQARASEEHPWLEALKKLKGKIGTTEWRVSHVGPV
jgi:hypothetical protein